MRSRLFTLSLAALAVAGVTTAQAATVTAQLSMATPAGPGAPVGLVSASDSPAGAVFAVDLHGLPPGQHGFHVHAGMSCAPGPDKMGKVIPAGAAAGHMDPAASGKHEGPQGFGHLGDLPLLTVTADGTDKETLTAPHITSVAALQGHALMVHAGGDNYSDMPAPLGGGGARIACGVFR